MKERLEILREKALGEIQNIVNLSDLEDLRVKFLGKKGEITSILRDMGKLSAEMRPIVGQMANDVRADIENKIQEVKEVLSNKAKEAKLAKETIDITVKTENLKRGHKHPLLATAEELE